MQPLRPPNGLAGSLAGNLAYHCIILGVGGKSGGLLEVLNSEYAFDVLKNFCASLSTILSPNPISWRLAVSLLPSTTKGDNSTCSTVVRAAK
jgi:hypothetical protein